MKYQHQNLQNKGQCLGKAFWKKIGKYFRNATLPIIFGLCQKGLCQLSFDDRNITLCGKKMLLMQWQEIIQKSQNFKDSFLYAIAIC